MKKLLLLCPLTITMLWLGALQASAIEKDDSGVYRIASVDDLIAFAEIVNYGDDTAANACLVSDLDLLNVTYYPIGCTASPYKGTFDGQGHTLNNLYTEQNVLGGDDYLGIFGVLASGAYIKNLVLGGGDNAFIGGSEYVGGIAGGTNGSGTVTIENCGNEAWIYTSGANAAGILGVNMLGEASVVITNCFNTGTIQGYIESAAISGWVGDKGIVHNCWNTGTVSGVDGSNTFCRSGAEFEDCWDVYGQQSGIGTISDDDLNGLATGEFCFKVLNQTMTEDISWYQTIGTDAHPVPFADHGVVYAVGDLYCDGTSKNGDTTYSNENSSQRDPHDFVDGECTRCGEFDPDYLTAGSDGFYNLASSADLYWFARLVNMKESNDASARLTADINYEKQQRMGVDYRYEGVFDGQEHTITVNLTNDVDLPALFSVTEDATIENLTIDGVLESNHQYASGIVGEAYGNTSILNCISAVDITDLYEGDGTHGGICAICHDNLTINNCAFVGMLYAPYSSGSGGVSGYTHNSETTQIMNTYVSGELTFATDDNAIICRNNPYIENCWVSSVNNMYPANDYTEFFDPQTVSTGELCFSCLNATNTTNPAWYQTLGTDNYPVPFPSHGIVYVSGAQNCDGTPKEGAADGYSNDPSGNRDPHTFVDGICSVCGSADPDYLTADSEGFYNLADDKQLTWFVKYTKSADTKDASARLTADIVYTGSEMIGAERLNYGGTFDGQGHTITVSLSTEDNRCALFDYVEDATITNLVVDGKIETLGQYAAGLVVESYGNTTISNVVVKTEIISYYEGDGTHGGICAIGHDFITIENCAFVGVLQATESEGCGGIMGYTHTSASTLIKDCYVSGELVLLEGSNNIVICRNNPVIENCWVSWDDSIYEYNDGVSFFEVDNELTSGELCFALNEDDPVNGVWHQTIGADAYPVPFDTSSVVYAHGTVNCAGSKVDVTYDNTEGELTYQEHNFVGGICTQCNNAYQISDADQLLDFSYSVLDGSASGAYAELIADIDLSGYSYLPIGGRTDEGGIPYTGTFDGKGHKILNMQIATSSNNQGLFGVVSGGACIKNIVIDGSCSVSVTGGSDNGYAAGLIGATAGSGKIVIEKCGNEADVTVDGPNAAGLLGVDDLAQVIVVMTDCYNTGTISGGRECAAICGWLGNGSMLTNCWNSGEIAAGLDGSNTFYRNTDVTVRNSNCYETIGSQVETISSETVESGELAYLLNGGNTQDVVWYQAIGSDPHPVFDASHGVVYYDYTTGEYNNDATGIGQPAAAVADSTVVGIYSVNGMKLENMQKGINIIRMSDGTVRKVIVK